MRWKPRSVIKGMEIQAELKLTQHPDKTLNGRIERGFDLLGYAFSAAGRGARRRLSSGLPNECPGFMGKMWGWTTLRPMFGGGWGGLA